MTVKFNRSAACGAVAAALLSCTLLSGATAAAEGPLGTLAGAWSGGGTINMRDGSSERLRCKATYAVTGAGTQAQQQLRCASDSYKVEIQSTVAADGQALVGTWTETTRGVSGNIRGRVAGSDITATIEGPGFGAGLGIGTRGGSQTINIRVNAGDIEGVSVSLKRN